MPRYRLMSPHFIEPDLIKADSIIEYDGPVTPDMEPLDEEAQKRMDAYFKEHPQASLNPVDNLPRTMATVVPEEPQGPKVLSVGGKK